MKAQTDHIQDCKKAWHCHVLNCLQCMESNFAEKVTPCEQGRILYDEYCQAVAADKEMNHETH